MEIIINNPYRLLGVYSTSSRHEIVANQGRMNAFLRVGQTITFPLDLVGILPAVSRSNHSVADAISRLTLPKDQLKYAQFWFAKKSPLDEIACGKLINGDIDGAMEIWRKRDSASSLQNLVVSSLIKKQFGEAIKNAQKLYTSFDNEFVKMVLGDNALATSDNLAHDFLDALCEEINPNVFLSEITIPDWKQYVGTRSTQPLIDSISAAIELSKSSKGNGSTARYNAGTKLMNDTKMVLQQLKQFVSTSDLQYQMIADKLGLEILQCGIDYYNNSDEADAAYKAMKLQKYAQSIVVGQMAKDRCDENVHILENIISKLPPKEVMAENKAILSCLATFSMQPKLIKHSIQLIKDCVPHIVAIKEKLGNTHKYYLEISTTIVNNALGNIIDEVNEAQQGDFENLKTTLIAAWRTQLYMDKFDLEPEYEQGRYNDSREALYGIIENCKGFESFIFSSRYRYGCGWCNDLDVSDVDLRTDDEYFASCRNRVTYRKYIKKYPSGKHLSEAKNKIEELTFKAAKTLADYQKYLADYPNGRFCREANDAINKFTKEENERKAKKERLDRAISVCNNVNEVIALYGKEKSNGIDADRCSMRAYELAEDEEDYKKVMEAFSPRSSGGKKAKTAIYEIEKKRLEAQEQRDKTIKTCLWIAVPLIALILVYFIWGVSGLSSVCVLLAIVFGFLTLCGLGSKDGSGCLVAIVCGLLAYGLAHLGNYLEKEAREENVETTESVGNIETNNDSYVYPYDDTLPVSDSDASYSTDYSSEPEETKDDDYMTYLENRLETGSKPYRKYYKSRTGSNYLDFKTSGNDYVIIVKDYQSSVVVNHIYVRANDNGRLYLPDGTYSIYFYGGKGWNPNMENGNVTGGFVADSHIQKDEPVELYNQYGEYTLYPVQNGNLQLQGASQGEAF